MLRNETFFKMNRFYLVGSALFSMIIPAMKADWIKELFITEKVQQLTHSVTYAVVRPQIEPLNVTTVASPDQPWLSAMEWVGLIYAAVSLVFLINFLRKLYQVNSTFNIKLKGRAFSFFGKIAVDEELEGKEIIIKHELVHARQWHSADVIFFEIFLAMNWFNPIVYIYRNAIKNIHEFIADDSAASTLEERSAYALLLVSSVFNTQPQRLTNNFFNQSLLKRRIIMLHKTKSRKVAILKYGLSVPLFAIMIIFSSAMVGKSQIVQQASVNIEQHLAKISVIPLSPDDKTDGKLPAAKKVTTAAPTDKVYTYKMVDAMAEYPGGQQSLYEYFKSEFRYTREAKEKGMKGQLVTRFIVEKDGSLSNIKILSDPGFDTGTEAMRLLQKSAVWRPAYLNKKAVRSVVDFPVNLYSPRYLMPEKDAAERLKISTKDTIAVFDRRETLIADNRPSPTAASFPGGVVAFSKYVSENMRYPEEARKNNISGIVSIAFAVNKDGSINNITVPEGIGYGCDEEAIRLIKNSPKWIPGHYPDGSPERMGYSLHIIFQAGKNN
jgi:TonB family protein